MSVKRTPGLLAPLAAWAVVLAAALGLVWALAGQGTPPAGPAAAARQAAPTALPVETLRIRLQDSYQARTLFTGRVQARRESALGFETAGRLAEVRVREGDRVETGDLLATLDTERLLARRAEQVAALAEAEARLALASATLERLRGVVESGGVSRQGLDEAREGRRTASAAVELARQRVAGIDVELAKSRLLAPFDGTLVERMADEGRVMATGEPVLRLLEAAPPEIRVGVAGDAVDRLEPGAVYALEHAGSTLAARLRTVLPLRSLRTRTVDALFDPVDADVELRPGDLVGLPLSVAVAAPGFWLPLSALAEGERGLWSLYVAVPDDAVPAGLVASHRISRHGVELVHQESGRVFVRGLVQPGAEVVASGLHRVVPGQWVLVSAAAGRPGA